MDSPSLHTLVGAASADPTWEDLCHLVDTAKILDIEIMVPAGQLGTYRGPNGDTLLIYIVKKKLWSLEFVEELPYIDPNIQNAEGKNALSYVSDDSRELFLQFHNSIDLQHAAQHPTEIHALLIAIMNGTSVSEIWDRFPAELIYETDPLTTCDMIPILVAAQYHRADFLRAYKERCPDATICEEFSSYPASLLHISARFGSFDCISAVKECFPSVDVAQLNGLGRTALGVAATNPAAGALVIAELAKYYPDLDYNARDDDGESPLTIAASVNSPENIAALHKFFPQLDYNAQASDGYSALIWAAQSGFDATIRMIHRCFPQSNPNLGESYGFTPLHWAAQNGFGHCIIALQECFGDRIDPNAQSVDGATPLFYACYHIKPQAVAALGFGRFPSLDPHLPNHAEDAPLSIAAIQGHVEVIDMLARAFPNIDPNWQPSFGFTAFAWAVHEDKLHVITALYHAFPNLDPNLCDDRNISPLHWTIENSNADAIYLLKRYFPNINPNIVDEDGDSALFYAARKGFDLGIKALRDCFPTLEILNQNKQGQTLFSFQQCIPLLQDIMYFPMNFKLEFSHFPVPCFGQLDQHQKMLSCVQLGEFFMVDDDSGLHPEIGAIWTITAGDASKLSELCCRYSNHFDDALIFRLLCWSIFHNWPAGLRVLLEHFPDIDINLTEHCCATPLLVQAAHLGFDACICALAQARPNIDCELADDQGRTALMMALEGDHASCIDILIDCFPTINPKNNNGSSLLLLPSKSSTLISLHRAFPQIARDISPHDLHQLVLKNPNCALYFRTLRILFPDIDLDVQDDVVQTAV